MNNNNCILVEFVNEENSVSVGYRNWLTTKVDDVCLQKVIDKKTIVQILWPLCEVKSASSMKRIIQGLKEKDWILAAVKIHAFGEWTVMHKQLNDLEKFNVINPCKKDRKTIMKKSFSDSDYDDSEKENIVKKKKKTDTKDNMRSTFNIAQHNILSQLKTSNIKLKDDLYSSSKESNETSFSDDNYEPKSEKNQNLLHLEEKIKLLRAEKKQLENEVKALKIEGLTSLKRKIKNLDTMADELAIKIQHVNQCIIELNKNIPTLISPEQQSYTEHTFKEDYDESDSNAKEKGDIIVLNIPADSKEMKLEPVDEVQNILESDVQEGTSESKIIKTINDNEQNISIGRGVTISQSMMENVRANDIRKMTCDLMSCVFTNKEMASSSRTGKKNNKAKDGEENNTVSCKKSLDRNKLLAMKDYVLSKFPNIPNGEKIFNNTVSNKCKNVARNYK